MNKWKGKLGPINEQYFCFYKYPGAPNISTPKIDIMKYFYTQNHPT